MKRKSFYDCMLRYILLFVAELLFAYVLSAVVVRGNDIIGSAIDDMLGSKDVQFDKFIVQLLILTVVGFLAAFAKSIMASLFSIKVQTRYKAILAKKLYKLEYKYFDENGSAAIINKMNSDIGEAMLLLNENMPELCTNVVALVTYSAYILKLNPSLLLLMVLCYPLILFVSNKIVKKIVDLRKGHREKADKITQVAQDCMSGILVLRSFGVEEHFQKKLDKAANELVDNEEKRTRISNTVIIIRKVLQWLPNIICACYAYTLVAKGDLSIGSLMAFVIILERFVDAFVGIPFNFVTVKERMVCVNRIENILVQNDEPSGILTEGQSKAPAITFEKVSFEYTKDVPVLKDLSFEIPIGSNAAFVGESGGGKSTIFHILCGFYEISGGKYKLLGNDYAQWNKQAARERMALVSQNVFLFPTTIYENVRFGRRDATKEEIVEACKNAGIHDFIISLPEGYDTIVGERGILLSGGERQRISIARAFLKDAPILLLDEPTSAIDVETESLIQQAIDKLSKNRTCITIAHRLSTIRNADKIMVMKDGRIVESGTHEELEKMQGTYATMYERDIKEGMVTE